MVFTLKWPGAVSCFRAKGISGDDQYVAGPYTFEFDVEFTLKDQEFQGRCPRWVYEVTFPGAVVPTIRFYDLRGGRVKFEFLEAPACQDFRLTWRAISTKREGDGPQECCGKTYNGSFPKSPYRFGPVCGQTCDDMDHDGIPDDEDSTPFG